VRFWFFAWGNNGAITSDRDEVAVARPSGDGLLPFLDELLHKLMGAARGWPRRAGSGGGRPRQMGEIFAQVDPPGQPRGSRAVSSAIWGGLEVEAWARRRARGAIRAALA